MLKLLQPILSTRKRRSSAAAAALWLLRIVQNAEKDTVYRYSNKISESDFRRGRNVIDDFGLNSEQTLGFLESAIENLEYAYERRF
jgi:hypothetical protein